MRARTFALTVACLLAGSAAHAGMVAGKLKSVDVDKKTMVVTTDGGQEQTFKVNDKTKIHISRPVEKVGQQYKDSLEDLAKWLGNPVQVTTDDKDKDLAMKVLLNSKRKILGPAPGR